MQSHQRDKSESGANAPPDAEPASPERAFARATGFVFQSVGFLLSLSTCCVWSLAYWWQDSAPPETTAQELRDWFGSATAGQVWATIGVAASFIGGLSLLVMGMGLQHDRLTRGTGPMALTGTLAGLFWVYLGVAAFQFPAAGRLVVIAVMALVWTGCFLLAGAAREQLKKAPPMPTERAWTSRDEDELRRTTSPRSPDRTNR